MRIVYGYKDRANEWFSGCIDATVEDALRIFKRFDGTVARLHVLVNEHSMIGWHMHGSKMYEVQLMNEQEQRKRAGQVPNQFAEDCIRRVFEGDRELTDLEGHAWFYSSGKWEPKADQDYEFYRSLTPDTPASGG
jgi:hypothetical protein